MLLCQDGLLTEQLFRHGGTSWGGAAMSTRSRVVRLCCLRALEAFTIQIYKYGRAIDRTACCSTITALVKLPVLQWQVQWQQQACREASAGDDVCDGGADGGALTAI